MQSLIINLKVCKSLKPSHYTCPVGYITYAYCRSTTLHINRSFISIKMYARNNKKLRYRRETCATLCIS